MKTESRKYKSARNFIYGLGTQVIIAVLGFVSRYIFIKVLGMEYLGINGLFSSILTVLSLAELGFGNIVIYSLYRPLADENYEKITALIHFYKHIYYSIAGIVAICGVLIIPILPRIVKTENHIEHLILYYVLFLANTVVSYLYVYKTSLIRADQKQFIISKYTMLMQIVMTCVQAVTLIVFKNYILYLILQMTFTFLTNYFLSLKANKLYPYLKNVGQKLERQEKKKIFNDVKAMFSYRVGGVLLNSTDNMFISALVNTVSVGIYSNYTMVIGLVNQFINVIYEALYSSVGNLNATGTKERQKQIFDMLVMAFSWIASFCFVCLFELVNPFLYIVFGPESLFGKDMILAICINFYLPIILYPIWMYRNTIGLFHETKNILIYTAALNIVLSYILGHMFGILGIISATYISRLSTSFWFEPFILYKKGFQSKSFEYFRGQIKYAVCTAVSIIFIECLKLDFFSSIYSNFVLRLFVCAVVPNMVLFVCLFR
ncbi:MAG: lipopolysaccharide biosynthesis protein, partial [Clostridia bacterium]